MLHDILQVEWNVHLSTFSGKRLQIINSASNLIVIVLV
jgi:hypothetical protein